MSSDSDARSVHRDALARGHAGQGFFGEGYGRISVLLEVEVREVLHVLERQALGVHHGWLFGSATRGADWMSSTNSRPAASSAAFTSSAVAEVSNSHAELALAACDIVDDALRGAVAQGVAVRIAAQRQHHVRERLHG